MAFQLTPRELIPDQVRRAYLNLNHPPALPANKVVVVGMLKIALVLNAHSMNPRLRFNDSQLTKFLNVAVNRIVTHPGKQAVHVFINRRHVDVLLLKLT